MVLNQQITGHDHTCSSKKTRRSLIHSPVLSSVEWRGRETPSNLALRLSGFSGNSAPADSSRHSNVKAVKLHPLPVTSAVSLRKKKKPTYWMHR